MSEMSVSEKKKEDWMNSKWRPMMGWMYMLVCTMDFVVFPILWSVIQALGGGRVETQWSPITLQGAGLFHMAMGAVLGVTAWSRGQEKLAGANNGGATAATTGFPSGSAAPSTSTTGFNSQAGSFSSPAAGINTGSMGFSTATAVSSSGKLMPQQPSQPEL